MITFNLIRNVASALLATCLLTACGETRVWVDRLPDKRLQFEVEEEHGMPLLGICGVVHRTRVYKVILPTTKDARYPGDEIEYRFFEEMDGDYMSGRVNGEITVDWGKRSVRFDLDPVDVAIRSLKGRYYFKDHSDLFAR